jgi:hypothetical protein
MSQEQRDLPPCAPADEPLERVRDRLVAWALRHRLQQHTAITALADLYDRRVAGDEPSGDEWRRARDSLARARARALDLDLALALALDLDLAALLGPRLQPIPQLDATILRVVEVDHRWGLEMGSYHNTGGGCGTTHCRAGSAIVLHPMGAELERVFGSWLAGAVIYRVSTGSVPDFFASNEDAMADMRRAAAEVES